MIGELALQKHNVVVQQVIPFTNHLHNRIALAVVGEEEFHKQGLTANVVPLRMNIKIVNLVAEFEFGIFLIEKRRKLIFLSAIQSSPIIIRL
jgi:hypothetical protein